MAAAQGAVVVQTDRDHTRSASTRLVRAKRCGTNNSEKAGSSWRTRIIVAFSSRMISHSAIAVAVAKRGAEATRTKLRTLSVMRFRRASFLMGGILWTCS